VALESGVPKSTAYGWLTRYRADVVTIGALDDVGELQREIILLRGRNTRLIAILRLIITVTKTTGACSIAGIIFTPLKGSPNFVPPAERIATFDSDGTLWCEQPLPVQAFFALDGVRAKAPHS